MMKRQRRMTAARSGSGSVRPIFAFLVQKAYNTVSEKPVGWIQSLATQKRKIIQPSTRPLRNEKVYP